MKNRSYEVRVCTHRENLTLCRQTIAQSVFTFYDVKPTAANVRGILARIMPAARVDESCGTLAQQIADGRASGLFSVYLLPSVSENSPDFFTRCFVSFLEI